jgi:hypothetical protein
MTKDFTVDVIDNFLIDSEFKKLQQLLVGDNTIPWYYNESVVNEDDGKNTHFQFTHLFYDDNIPTSHQFNQLQYCIDRLNIISLIRIKANLLTKTEKTIIHEFHTDILNLPDDVNTKTSILYMNTNDGYTLFEDGQKIESIENRLVTFDSRLPHTGTTCTDEKIRVIINFNYV